MSKPALIVSMTGFVHDPSLPNYQQMLQQIGCKYAEQLSSDVNYLIVNHVCTEKYKIAELDKSSIQCITIKWLEESAKVKQILPIDHYHISKIFYGVRIIMEGFQDKLVLARVKKILQENGAIQVREGIQGILTEEYQLVIVPNVKFYKKIQLKIQQFLDIPLVTTEWVQQSLKQKKCKYPNDYALNLQNLHQKQFNDPTNIRRLNRKLQSFMQLDFMRIKHIQNIQNSLFPSLINNKKSTILFNQEIGDQLIIYLDQNSIQKAFSDLLKKLIAVSGGLYLKEYGPIVTHILVGPVEENQYIKFMNYGDAGHVVRVEWLIDSILLSEKLPEIDFKVRSFKSATYKSSNSIESHRFAHSQTNFDANSRNYQSISMAVMPIMETKSLKKIISISKEPVKQKIVPTKVIKTDIFKGRYFYVDKSKKQPFFQSLVSKIKQNGGFSVSESSLSQLRNRTLLVVLKDSDKNEQILSDLNKTLNGISAEEVCVAQNTADTVMENMKPEKKDKKSKIEIVPVSTRWVEECIKKTQFIDYRGENMFSFKPFNINTPARELMTMKIEILGMDEVLKRRYKELLIALGINKVSPNISEITHCLCKGDYERDPRYEVIMLAIKSDKKQKETVSKEEPVVYKVSGSIKFIKYEWATDFPNKKGEIKLDDYLIKTEDKIVAVAE